MSISMYFHIVMSSVLDGKVSYKHPRRGATELGIILTNRNPFVLALPLIALPLLYRTGTTVARQRQHR
jgi:hypothetical protein